MKQVVIIAIVCLCSNFYIFCQQPLPFSSAQRDMLVKKYAPELRFHKEEKYFPLDVNDFLPFVELRNNKHEIVLPLGQVTKEKLAQYRGPEHSDYYLNIVKKENYTGKKPDTNGLIHVRGYANFIPTPDGARIQYHFFYPYNGPFQIGKLPARVDKAINLFTQETVIGEHEGDWEHITVNVTGSNPDNLTLKDIYYARHRPSQDGGFESKPELVEGTHPVVYPSKWGHASHPHHRDRHANQDATSSNGPRWKMWEDIVVTGSKEAPAPEASWLAFSGRWGGSENGKGSPRNPAHQPWLRTSAFQVLPPANQNPYAKARIDSERVNKKYNLGGKVATAFAGELEPNDTFPSYIRKLLWQMQVITPNVKPEDISYNIYDAQKTLLASNVTGPQAITPVPEAHGTLASKNTRFFIGDIRTKDNKPVVFDLSLRGLFD